LTQFLTKTFKNAINNTPTGGIMEEPQSSAVETEEKELICPDCKSKDIEYENSEHFCKKCGLVLD
tara:strand:+ start:18325 stop:18519 length:195 start_codon:yes stop_codon:yes gene_type:complete